MAELFKVKNLAEAFELAKQFKAENKFNLFRGQAQNWEVISTMGRLSEKQFNEAKEKIERLYYYFETNPTLKKFNSDIDWFYAIAQHYGIPTSYIDFTSNLDVAFYFATNSKSNKVGENCSIICLDERDFKSFIKKTNALYEKDNVVAPYISRVNVDNLWRLQAQCGCFLFTPYSNIEFIYDFDRILFPYTEPFAKLSAKQIYPNRKSELEILLDHYFNTEDRIEGQKRFQKFAKEINSPITILNPPDFEKVLKKKKVHKSWKSSFFKSWHFPVNEEWKTADTNHIIPLSFSFKNDTNTQIETTIIELIYYFQKNKIDRLSPLEFKIFSIPKLKKKLSKKISKSCSRIWDGTRNLPFSDYEIFSIISKYIYLEIYEEKLDNTPSISGEQLIALELTNEYGSITRCLVSPSKVISAFRDDICDILIDDLTREISSTILLHVNIPTLIFDFNKLLKLFKEEMIAYQVLYNSEKEKPVIFYTPTQITVMGYA